MVATYQLDFVWMAVALQLHSDHVEWLHRVRLEMTLDRIHRHNLPNLV